MPNIKVKVCGIKSIGEVNAVNKTNAKWLGMIFYKNSPRNISYNIAHKILQALNKRTTPVAVLVNPTKNKINKLKLLGINMFQLHGHESPDFCKSLVNELEVKLIKSIGVQKREDIIKAEKYKGICEWILFDAKIKGSKLPGGNGIPFNWNFLEKNIGKYNWILSGGLNTTNIKRAIKKTGAQAVDASSGLEDNQGKKQTYLIQKFCKLATNV